MLNRVYVTNPLLRGAHERIDGPLFFLPVFREVKEACESRQPINLWCLDAIWMDLGETTEHQPRFMTAPILEGKSSAQILGWEVTVLRIRGNEERFSFLVLPIGRSWWRRTLRFGVKRVDVTSEQSAWVRPSRVW